MQMGDDDGSGKVWRLGYVRLDDQVAIVRVNMQHDGGLRSHPYRLMASVVLSTTRENGLPDQAESDRLEALARAFRQSLAGRAVPTAVVTVPHRRDLLYAAQDVGWCEAWAAEQVDAHPDRELEFGVAPDPDWDLYGHLLEEVRPAHDDLQAIKWLIEHGVDLSEPRQISYFFDLPDQTQAAAVATVLRNHDYQTTVNPRQDGGQWRVVASHRERLTPAIMAQLRPGFRDLAVEHGGVFDGWEAALGDLDREA
jgi:hypothetical protein